MRRHRKTLTSLLPHVHLDLVLEWIVVDKKPPVSVTVSVTAMSHRQAGNSSRYRLIFVGISAHIGLSTVNNASASAAGGWWNRNTTFRRFASSSVTGHLHSQGKPLCLSVWRQWPGHSITYFVRFILCGLTIIRHRLPCHVMEVREPVLR